MQITFSIQGEKADLVSYFFGKHPDHPYHRDTEFGIVEFKFIEYTDAFVKGFVAFHANGLAMTQDSGYRGLEQYITDREFSLSTIFLTSIRNSIGHVLSPDYDNIDRLYNVTLEFGPVSTKLSDETVQELLTPLGYEVSIEHIQSHYGFVSDSGQVMAMTLTKETDIVSVFRHLYVLIPVMDNYKHHRIATNEVEKLVRYGSGWLESHPLLDFILKRYLRYKANLIESTVQQLGVPAAQQGTDSALKSALNDLRYETFLREIQKLGVQQVVDMGAGEGKLLRLLVQNQNLTEIIATDPAEQALTSIHYRLAEWHKDGSGTVLVEPKILQSSLFYRDERLVDKECILLCEVIEHIDRSRIDETMNLLLTFYHPRVLLLSTPNREYNEVYGMGSELRHRDHRFEMSRQEFHDWIRMHSEQSGYAYEIKGIGDMDRDCGQPTQMAVLIREVN
ncbi:hypothetical protein [Alicyclobacillus sp. SO9]|uniref:hypothetical protein n=1 Tax=Alicyclobacillus sp. SO9 TaxID=2665646 RepID=UPI0018E6DC90|nr:hypothetical protein [Alicyclobacillus sp. SO9]QQE78708.1 hypothetical protein GI364_23125 [Alicyclobacillus sp. SO9]